MSYDINSNILSHSGLTTDQLEGAIKAVRPGNGFAGVQMFIDAETKYGINALFIVAHAAVESAWGTSYYARTRHNLFGFDAYDSDPSQASGYKSQADAVDYYAGFLKNVYLTPPNGKSFDGVPVGRDYHGTTPHTVFTDYSTSHDSEAQTVVGIMNLLAGKVTNTQPAPPKAAPAGSHNGDYIVRQGDTLWAIANAHSLSLSRLIQLNPQISNPNLITPGEIVHVSGYQPPRTYTVKKGDTLSGIGAMYHTSWQQLQALNHLDNPDLIFPGQVLRIR